MFCCILGSLLFLICIEFVYLYFPVLFCLSVSVKRLAVKTASEMTYIVSSGALNSIPTNQPRSAAGGRAVGRSTRRRSVGRDAAASCGARFVHLSPLVRLKDLPPPTQHLWPGSGRHRYRLSGRHWRSTGTPRSRASVSQSG